MTSVGRHPLVQRNHYTLNIPHGSAERVRQIQPVGPCRDCGRGEDEYYLVLDDIWALTGLAPGGGHLCLRCCQGRVGFKLRKADFEVQPGTVSFVERPAE